VNALHKRKQATTNVEPLLLTIPQVGAMLGLGHSKVYDLIRQEGLPTVKFGTATRVPAEELKQWVKQRIA
jgi:excisionase family DNA binding protein